MTSSANIIDSIQKYAAALGGNQAFGSRTVYRGQIADKVLLPKLFRIERIPSAARSLGNFEQELLEDFKNQAKSFLVSSPVEDNVLEWLALAQHHGLSTRLLDWTQSPLTALFSRLMIPIQHRMAWSGN